MTYFLSLLKLLRTHHWVKNVFIFIPGFFAGILFNLDTIIVLLYGFLSFCLISSSVYIINDLRDVEYDRNHPIKKNRPIASATVSEKSAKIFFFIIFLAGISISIIVDLKLFIIITIYFLVNLAYSFGLKRISILDIFIIAFGFVLRTIAGGLLLNIALSSWLMIMIFLLALFLAMAKRLDDVIVNNNTGNISRSNFHSYNIEFITSGITMLSGIIIVSYLMYTISDEVTLRLNSEYLYCTSVFVIAGLMRYLQITLVDKDSGSPTRILYRDKFIIVTLMIWMLSFLIIIYF